MVVATVPEDVDSSARILLEIIAVEQPLVAETMFPEEASGDRSSHCRSSSMENTWTDRSTAWA